MHVEKLAIEFGLRMNCIYQYVILAGIHRNPLVWWSSGMIRA